MIKSVFIVQTRLADFLHNVDCFSCGYAAKTCGEQLAKAAKSVLVDQRITTEGLLRITWFDIDRKPIVKIMEMTVQNKYG